MTNSFPIRFQVKTPLIEGTSSDDESDTSSSHSCELDLAVVGEAPWQQKRWHQTAVMMKKLQVPEPTLKRLKDLSYRGYINAS